MAQSNKTCPYCKKVGHSGFYCPDKPTKPIKRTVVKRKPIARIASLAKFADNKSPVWDQASGGFITIYEKKSRKKKTPRASVKTKSWDAFSLYIRTRDCIRFTGDPEQGICITCKTPHPRKELQAGHFIGGRGNAVLFREDLVYSQCYYCNQKPPMGLGGNYVKYTLFMLDEGYSVEQIEEFTRLKGTTKVYKTHDFLEIEQRYKEKLAEILP